MKSNRQTIRLKMHLFCAFFVLFGIFMSCEKEEEPKPIIVEKPGNQNEDETPELLSKWIYVGQEWDSEFIYDEANYLEFYSDSTYISHWFGEEQRGNFCIDSFVTTYYTSYSCIFSSSILWENRPNSRWSYNCYTEERPWHPSLIPSALMQMIDSLDLAARILRLDSRYCVVGCGEYFVTPRELETSGVKNKFQ